jgi:hypothetical protein
MKYQYKKVLRAPIAIVEVTPLPEWEEFSDFVDYFIANEDAKVIEQDYGMDRHQIRYRKGGHQYILQFEHYTQSIWIEQDY